MPKNPLFKRFLIWRAKHISQKQFVYLLSIVVGFTSGVGAVVLKNATHFIQHLLENKLVQYYHTAFYFVFPIIGFTLVYLIMKYVIRQKVSHGIPSTLFAIAKRKGLMKRYQMFGSILTAPITVGFGGSVGLEGPTVATGAALGSNISRLFHMNQSTRNLLVSCAAAGAMSSIFKAPIAAIIFAIEVFSLDLTIASMLPLLLASLSAILTSFFFFGDDVLLPFKLVDEFNASDAPFYALLGLVAAAVSIYFTEVYDRIQRFFDKIGSPFKRVAFGGICIGILVYLIPPLYGEGFEVINNLVAGNPEKALQNNFLNLDLSSFWVVIALLVGLVFFKIIASALTFGAGGVGGIFAPTLFMGSIMGNCIAKIINHSGWVSTPVSESNFTLVGMAGLLAGVLQAPLTAIFLIAELTGGYDLFIPLMITAAIAFSVTKYFVPHSVYTMELGRKGDLITHNKDHAVLTFMDIDSVIETNFQAISSKMNLGEIVREAVTKSNRNIFPVISEKTKRLEGIILLDDIRSIMFDQTLYDEVKASDVMHNPPDIIDIEKDKMTVIMKKFQDSNAWNLPVVRDGVYIGFISKSKLLTAYRRKLIALTH
ncbi:chloride channel protein [Subsaximicrobium wynnwilliamsii]|uniref:Chloride channel protein n=1 Tax=Subsaximicrobium wynnwilliamsii TaxID=291179 RepID=A0A5C6ZAM8_9FLAO|nr:chloride channel protein [Subsaximicrobium wynnwilliamsii]TXD81896.1 chloride channel protein [Subsaximicrobium wynnwilliamsii]TXD87015.1 chloride channel protein [Subsaximicrobium wynnwilliamsii]TXE01347.1 chloride channel protein [Subsaximicrobium wynnwilliamsii]